MMTYQQIKETGKPIKSIAICYKTINPIIYNEGTKYEKREYTFLRHFVYTIEEDAEMYVNELNNNHPEYDSMNHKINWNEIEYFFWHEQEVFK